MTPSEWLALLAAFCLGSAATLSKPGLRYVPPLTGATISLPATAIMFWVAAPFLLVSDGFRLDVLLLFALVGAFFPAAVTILNFEATRRMGPTVSVAVTSTSAAFAVLTAIVFLDEPVTWLIVSGTLIIVAGVVVMSWDGKAVPRQWAGWVLLLPLAGAVIRGNSQTLMKYGLNLWQNPFIASLVGYTVSASVIWMTARIKGDVFSAYDRRAVPWFCAVGLFNGCGLFLTYLALEHGSVGVVAPIVTTAPLFTLIEGWLFLREERFNWPVALGVLATVFGVVLILLH